jgi:hypothetical protein
MVSIILEAGVDRRWHVQADHLVAMTPPGADPGIACRSACAASFLTGGVPELFVD